MSSQKPTNQQGRVTPDALKHLALSKVVYAANDTKNQRYAGSTSAERLTQALKDPKIASLIGDDWSVCHSTRDAAVFVNKSTHEAVLAIRGSQEIDRDFIANDFLAAVGMYNSRTETTLKSEGPYLDELRRDGFSISTTGHSMGGDVASAIGGMLGIPVYTFNSPELMHKHRLHTNNRDANTKNGNVHHYRHEGDIISMIKTDGTEARTFILIENRSCSKFDVLCAHSIDNMLEGMSTIASKNENQEFSHPESSTPFKSSKQATGKESPISEQGAQTTPSKEKPKMSDETKESNSNDHNHVHHTIDLDTTSVASKIQTMEIKLIGTENGLFRVTETFEVQMLIGQEIITKQFQILRPSPHVLAATSVGKSTFVSQAVMQVLNPGKIDVGALFRDSLESAGVAFATSVVTEKMIPLVDDNTKLGSQLGATAVTGTYLLLKGDARGALKASFNNIASAIMEHATGLPISLGQKDIAANGQLFGSGIQLGYVDRKHVSMQLHAVNFGLHFDDYHEIRSLRNGQVVERKAHEIGFHGGAFGADCSAGLQSGYEASSKTSSTTANGVTKDQWFDRDFNNELNVSFQLGSRRARFRILPAFSSLERRFTLEYRKDGGDINMRSGCPLQHKDLLSFSPMQQQSDPPKSDGQTVLDQLVLFFDSQQYFIYFLGNERSKSANEEHKKIANIVLQKLEGRTEHDLQRNTITKTKKRWFGLSKKRWIQVLTIGRAEESHSETQNRETNGQIISTVQTKTVVSQYTKDEEHGKVKQKETITNRIDSKTTLYSKSDGSSMTSRHTDTVDENGRHNIKHEDDLHRETNETTICDENGKTVKKIESEHMIGQSSEVTSGPAQVLQQKSGLLKTKKETEVTRVIYRDKRSEKIHDENGDTKTSTYNSGEKREADGFQTYITETETSSSNGFLLVNQKIEIREKRKAIRLNSNGELEVKPDGGSEVRIQRETKPGFLWDEVKEKVTEQKQGETPVEGKERVVSTTLSPGANRCLSIAVSKTLQGAYQIYMRWQKQSKEKQDFDKREEMKENEAKKQKKEYKRKKFVPKEPLVTAGELKRAMFDLTIDMGEGWGVAMATNLASHTKQLGDAVPWAFFILATCAAIRHGLWCSDEKTSQEKERTVHEEEEEKKQKANPNYKREPFVPTKKKIAQKNIQAGLKTKGYYYDTGEEDFDALVFGCVEVARVGIQLSLAAIELSCSGPLQFFISQIISAGLQTYTAVRKYNLGWADIWKPLLGSCLSAGFGTAVSYCGGLGVSYLLGATALTLTGSATIVVATSACFVAGSYLFSWWWNSWSGDRAHHELNGLLKKWGISTEDSREETKRKWKKLCLKHHPDKGGDTKKFQELQNDFDRIFEIYEEKIDEEVAKKENIDVDYLANLYKILRAFIAKLRSENIDEKTMKKKFDLYLGWIKKEKEI